MISFRNGKPALFCSRVRFRQAEIRLHTEGAGEGKKSSYCSSEIAHTLHFIIILINRTALLFVHIIFILGLQYRTSWTVNHETLHVNVQSHTSPGLTNNLHHDLSYCLNFGLRGQNELWLNPADRSVPDYKSPCQTFPSSNCNERNRFMRMCRNSILKYIPLIS